MRRMLTRIKKRVKKLLMPDHESGGTVAYLVCGLGNPGSQYAVTRHNVGFMAVDELARQERISLKQRTFAARWGRGAVAGVPVALAKPQTFMNRSDRAVVGLLNHFHLGVQDLIVVYDDLDLEPGRLRIRPRGGSGGHRGIESIIQALATDEFTRIRIGIGRPEGDMDPIDHVLGEFLAQEEESLELSLKQAVEAVTSIVNDGTEAAMNRFNASREMQ